MIQRHSVSHKLLTVDFAITWAMHLLVFTSSHLVMPIVPLYALHIGQSEGDVGWITASFAVAGLVSRLLAGKWSDRVGPAKVMRIAATLLLASAIAYNFAGVVWVLIIARVLHGGGVGAYSTSSSSLVAYMVPPTRRGQALGLVLLCVSVAMGIGPMIGMFLVTDFGYSTLFALLIAVALVPVLGVSVARRLRRYGPTEISAGKLVNLDAMLAALMGATGNFTYGALVAYIPLYALQNGLDNPGWFFAAYAGAAIVVRLCLGGIIDRFGSRATIIASALLMSLSTLLLTGSSEPWSIVVLGGVYGLGIGVLFPAVMAFAVDLVDPQERASAVATFLASTDVGLILGAAVSGLVVTYFSLPAVWIVAGTFALGGTAVFATKAPRTELRVRTG